MKKLIFGLSVVGLLFAVSCKKEESKEVVATETPAVSTEMQAPAAPANAADTTAAAVTEAKVAALAIPAFKSADLAKYAQDYTVYAKDLAAAAKAGNAAKLAELQAKGADWVKNFQALAGKLSADDMKLWNDYKTQLAAELRK